MTLALAMGWSSRGPCLKAQTGKGGTIPNSGVVTDPTIPPILTFNAVDTLLRLIQVKLAAE